MFDFAENRAVKSAEVRMAVTAIASACALINGREPPDDTEIAKMSENVRDHGEGDADS